MGEIRKYITIFGEEGKKLRKKALIDSGASISAIDEKFSNKLKLPKFGKKVLVRLPDGRTKKVDTVFAGIKFPKMRIVPIEFVVLKGLDDVILGVDFLQQYDIKIDWEKEKVNVPKLYRKKVFRL